MIIPKAIITQIEERIDIVELIGTYVSLQRKGERFWACCPFHSEKSPSFTVDVQRKTYHCFGCKERGNAFQFYMAMEGVSFVEACTVLAKRVGIELTAERQEVQQAAALRKSMQELYQKLTGSFEYLLWNSSRGEQALVYLTSRNISEESLRTFRVGYGMSGPHELYQFLAKRGYSDDFLATTGLFSSKNLQYSLFRDRIMFPLMNVSGEVIAFSGRAMPDAAAESPKYINSPQTPLFIKRRELFGMAQAKEALRRQEEFILCEGAMDVIALHQMGYQQAVAPLGSAFTQEQAMLLQRFAKKGILFMDSDAAGQKAIRQAAILCEQNGIYGIRAVRLQAGKDPSECLEYGQEEILTNSVKSATLYFDFLLQETLKNIPKDQIDQQLEASSQIFEYLSVVQSPARKESYVQMLAAKLKLSHEAVASEYQRFESGYRGRNGSGSQVYDVQTFNEVLAADREALIELLCACLMQSSVYQEYQYQLEFIDFAALGLQEVWQYLQEAKESVRSMDDLLSLGKLDLATRELLQDRRLSMTSEEEGWQERARRAMARIVIQELTHQRTGLLHELAGVQPGVEMVIVHELQREINEINSELQGIRGGVYG